MVEQRVAYLNHLSVHGYARGSLRIIAADILGTAEFLPQSSHQQLTEPIVEQAADDYFRSTHKHAEAARKRIRLNIVNWLRFAGALIRSDQSNQPFADLLSQFVAFRQSQCGLSSATLISEGKLFGPFLAWVHDQDRPFDQISVQDIDRFLLEKGKTWNRRTVACNAGRLRTFFAFAERQGWCSPGISKGIEGPKVYRQENIPWGPTWEQVINLIGLTNTDTRKDIRDRAILLLFAVNGLRCKEVRYLRLEDIDWEGEKLLVRRTKVRRLQELPLTREVGYAIIRYLREVRPCCQCREVFITLKAPWAPLSAAQLYHVVSERLATLGVTLAHRGPHSLRHAFATRMMATGCSLKEIGDCLGHQSAESTQTYAKVDLAGLREAGSLELGELL
jgi:site-specific recombinase XerD